MRLGLPDSRSAGDSILPVLGDLPEVARRVPQEISLAQFPLDMCLLDRDLATTRRVGGSLSISRARHWITGIALTWIMLLPLSL